MGQIYACWDISPARCRRSACSKHSTAANRELCQFSQFTDLTSMDCSFVSGLCLTGSLLTVRHRRCVRCRCSRAWAFKAHHAQTHDICSALRSARPCTATASERFAETRLQIRPAGTSAVPPCMLCCCGNDRPYVVLAVAAASSQVARIRGVIMHTNIHPPLYLIVRPHWYRSRTTALVHPPICSSVRHELFTTRTVRHNWSVTARSLVS